jgi:ABC-type cobalamin/Fe3+-siderophores transport system ATPase subunit
MDYTDKQLATVIGVVLTEKCSLRNMTVEELVGMGRSPYTGFWGNLSKEDKKTVNDAIALVRIEDLKYRMVHTLSDGERQKVMIAKALAQETPVIFLDEPTAFLDFPSKVEIMQLLHHLSRSTNKTIFPYHRILIPMSHQTDFFFKLIVNAEQSGFHIKNNTLTREKITQASVYGKIFRSSYSHSIGFIHQPKRKTGHYSGQYYFG